MSYETHLQHRLDDAASTLAFEPLSPSLWKTLERLTTVLMKAEVGAGRVRGFAVRCDEALNPREAEAITVEVSYLPPSPRARAVVLRLRGPAS